MYMDICELKTFMGKKGHLKHRFTYFQVPFPNKKTLSLHTKGYFVQRVILENTQLRLLKLHVILR